MPSWYIAGNERPRGPVSGGNTDTAEALAFIARTTGLNATHINAYKTLINNLVFDGDFALFDGIYTIATDTANGAHLLNLRSTSFALTQSGTGTFTPDQGWAGNGSTGFLNTGFTPSTAGGVFTNTSAHMSVYIRTTRTTSPGGAAFCAIGGLGSAANSSYLTPIVGTPAPTSTFAGMNQDTAINLSSSLDDQRPTQPVRAPRVFRSVTAISRATYQATA